MAGSSTTTKAAAKFAGIEIPPQLTKNNFTFLYLNTFLAGMLMSVLGLLQSAFLKDSIHSNHVRSVNWLPMNVNEISVWKHEGTYEKIRRCNH